MNYKPFQLHHIVKLLFLTYLLSSTSFSAICRHDCHTTRGYCDVPGDCRCRLGWAGKTCQECQVLPGCVHGYCDKPLECKCFPGYTGILCQKRKYQFFRKNVNLILILSYLLYQICKRVKIDKTNYNYEKSSLFKFLLIIIPISVDNIPLEKGDVHFKLFINNLLFTFS